MARNVIHEAQADAKLHDDRQIAHRMREHAGTPMYLGELVAALGAQRWASVKQHGNVGDLAKTAEDAAHEIKKADDDAAGSHDHGAHVVHIESARPRSLYLERYTYWLYNNHHNLHELDNLPQQVRQILGLAAGQAELDGIMPASAVIGAARPAIGGTDGFEAAATATVTTPLANARGKLADAEHALAALDDELQLQLREIAPAVWDPHEHDPGKQHVAQQRVAAYIKDFRTSKRYRNAQDQVRRWGGVVKDQLATSEALLFAHGHDAGAPAEAKHATDTLLGSYEAMAISQSNAQEAALWALAHETDGRLDKAAQTRVKHIAEIAQATDGYYKAQQMTDIVRSAGDHKTGIFNAIAFLRHNVITPYQRFKQIRGLTQLGSKLEEITTHWQVWRAPNAHVAQQHAAEFIRATGEGSPIVSKVGTAFGVLIGLGDKSTALAQVDNPLAFADSVKGLYDNIRSFKELLAKGVKSPSEEERAAAMAKQIHGRYVLLGKSFALIGVAGGALGIKDDLASINKYGNDAATDVKLVGDVATALGSALTMTPLWPIGEALNLIGSTISLIAGAFTTDHVGNARRDDERDRMRKLHTLGNDRGTHDLAATFTNDDAAGNLADAQRLGLTGDQIHRLGEAQAFLFRDGGLIAAGERLRHFLLDHKIVDRTNHKLVGPAAHSLFEFLMASHEDTQMKVALMLAKSNVDGPPEIVPSDIRDRIVLFLTQAMPKAYVKA